ncbi:Z1 domain-containing protein [Cohaesibacter marisflavi]|uniref:Z1 domain-containing protein n=1 Tax=Cohaesibacter marisflavi TaxID=655353 RepID=UPI0029C96F26|nr:Z1 domain-containing protein [Cohaesibacter marisflavi]
MQNEAACTNLIGLVDTALFGQERKTGHELRILIKGLAAAVAPELGVEELEYVARVAEEKQGIRAGLGAILDSEDYEPWLDDAKSSIVPFYWSRYRQLLLKNGLPKDVVISTDTVTDRILSRLGNPMNRSKWDRRGMVVGHVQSGKTSNYTGLICKAADAGYRLIIVIAGIHNNLRNQTQERIDEGFIGRDTGKKQISKGHKKFLKGVGHFDPSNTPVSLTNTLKDFNKATASTNTSEIDSYKVPVVLVIKKNYRTLGNLLDWLRDNSAKGDNEMIDQPMLLIDDEADNASINTKYKKSDITKINGQIRDLLNMFHRSCYVGYTATPFANIFIDPDQEDEMRKEDLFPRNFIIGLDAPTNYFGPKRVFIDGLPEDEDPVFLRYIDDNEPFIPISHKIDLVVDELPPSLEKAVRLFLVARTIRNLRNQVSAHCSMLVNASRFTAVQRLLRNRIHDLVERIQNAVRINASKGSRALSDPEIAALKEVWETEYSDTDTDWSEIQAALFDAIASAKVVEVNSNANGLDYSDAGEKGQCIIAVGGYSLSRGLTLEGLTVTWFLRNTMMYDTLMQMGRWFGYRGGYEDLCRIWMPDNAIEWYSFIAEATDELFDELKKMENAKATPEEFGLAVRSHPASLLVTARNKMGAGQKVTTQVGLSNKFVETARVSINPGYIDANRKLVEKLVARLVAEAKRDEFLGQTLFREVSFDVIDEFLAGWRNALQSIQTDPAPVRSYIRAGKDDELGQWDVLIAGTKNKTDEICGIPVGHIERYVGLDDLRRGFMSFSGSKMRVGSRGIEKAGINPQKAEEAELNYLTQRAGKETKPNFPDRIYRQARERPLFIIYLVQATPPKNMSEDARVSKIPSQTVVAWGMSLPASARPEQSVEYIVTPTWMREMFGEEDVDEEFMEIIDGE